jgi:drug/metabolite transporter (DMT)-like permease
MKAGPLVLCVLAAALFGVSSPVSKALLGSLSPLTLAGLLYLGAALAVLPFSLSGGSREARRARKNLARLAGVVLFGGVLGPALLLFGLSTAPAASVSLWLNLETPATALLGWMFFKEHLDRRVVVAVVLVTIASALLAGASGAALVPSALLVAAACACWGLDNNLSATIDGFTPAQSTLAKGVAAGAVNHTRSVLSSSGRRSSRRMSARHCCWDRSLMGHRSCCTCAARNNLARSAPSSCSRARRSSAW